MKLNFILSLYWEEYKTKKKKLDTNKVRLKRKNECNYCLYTVQP